MQSNNLPKALDGRTRVTKDLQREIMRLHYLGASMRHIARETGLARQTVKYTIYPEFKKQVWEQNAQRAREKNYYYDKDRHREQMRKHRAKKKQLMDEGKI